MGGQAGRDLLSVVGEVVDVGRLGDVEAGGAGAQLEREQVGRPAGAKAEAGQVADRAAAGHGTLPLPLTV
jgi:predicted NBD/HSP70 family sugar kinase